MLSVEGQIHRSGSLLRLSTVLPAGAISSRIRGTLTTQIELVNTRVFAATPDGGNPCPVVPQPGNLKDSEMLSIAKRCGFEAAFIFPAAGDADIRIRYFLPDHELGVSGHATIAAIAVAHSRGLLKSDVGFRVETINGIFPASIYRSEAESVVTLQQGSPAFAGTLSTDVVAHALGCSKEAIGLTPIQSVSVSRPKLIVPMRDASTLAALSPSAASIDSLCEIANVSGIYPFTTETDIFGADVEARQFPFRAGYAEDAATGVAAVALAAYVCRYCRRGSSSSRQVMVAQGYRMGRPSLIGARVLLERGTTVRTEMHGSASILASEWMTLRR